MGPTLVMIFLGVFALAIGQGIVRRKLNPYGDAPYERIPGEARAEVDRLLPGFSPSAVRLTRKGDESRIAGRYRGEEYRLEIDFDDDGRYIDLDVDGPRGAGVRGLASFTDLSDAARHELDRVLGEDAPGFEPHLVKSGEGHGERHHEVKGRTPEWKWEVTVSQSGRLLQLERERRRTRA